MSTEEEIIYAIWDIVRAGSINQDDSINERLLRSFLRIHRGKHINKTFKKGVFLPDELFQELGSIPFLKKGTNNYVSSILPKVIRMKSNFGILANKDDYTISIVNSEEFLTSKKNPYNKFHPKMKFVNNELHLYPGIKQVCCSEDQSLSSLNLAVESLYQESLFNKIELNVRAVLVNPDDEPGYDFTSSIYPYPDELIEDLINSVKAREFNIFLRTKSDETTDSRNNTSEFQTREEF